MIAPLLSQEAMSAAARALEASGWTAAVALGVDEVLEA
ncbi:hypothetical protein SynSYN20_01021 [Synechococcus sp. SYN20]|nr:hypothetical protein SynSYN20_01021 [Synechococcus sp. SYN20]